MKTIQQEAEDYAGARWPKDTQPFDWARGCDAYLAGARAALEMAAKRWDNQMGDVSCKHVADSIRALLPTE